MKKIANWNEIKEFASFKNPVGGFVCTITGVEDVSEKEYLKVYYDITEAVTPEQEEFVGMYEKRKQERGFDHPATIVSYKDTSLSFFKAFVTALENSNEGYEWDNDETKFVGLKIGFVIGEEEYEGRDKDGAPKIKVRTYVAERRSVDTIKNGDFKVPEFKKLVQKTATTATNPFATNGSSAVATNTEATFSPVEDVDECPF